MKKQKVTKDELRNILKKCPINADLNHLDVSGI
jgi:hypothetical protein